MMSGKNNDTSVLGPSSQVTGNISGEGALRIDGRVHGSVELSGALQVSEGATLAGNASASDVLVDGTLTGDVDSSGSIRLGESAHYEGTLRSQQISIAPGAKVSAKLDTGFELELDI